MTTTPWDFLINISRAKAYLEIVKALNIQNEEEILTLNEDNTAKYNPAVIEKIDKFYSWKTCQEFLYRYIIREDGEDVEFDSNTIIKRAYPVLEKVMVEAFLKYMSDKGELTLCWDAKRNDFVYVKSE
jgi:hypothetical protein